MKKTLLLTFASLFLVLSLVGCGEKKVQSPDHFGYTSEFVKENFDVPDGFKLSPNDEKFLTYIDDSSNGKEQIWFSKLRNDTYIDNINLTSASQEVIKQYFELVDDLFDITANSQEVSDIMALIDSGEMATIELSDGSHVSFAKLERVFNLIFNKALD